VIDSRALLVFEDQGCQLRHILLSLIPELYSSGDH
jgi:hypothetical protein